MAGGLIGGLIMGAIVTTYSVVKARSNHNNNKIEEPKEENVSGGWKCPICGKSNERFTKVCSSCKYDVKPDGWVCPVCGEINEKETNICKCGYEDF